MNRETTLSKAIDRIATAYVFLNLDINLNGINILPDWIGCLWIFCQLDSVAKAEKSTSLLKTPALLLACWGVLTAIAGEHLGWLGNFGALIAAAVALYFHFQLITDLSFIADRHSHALGDKLRRLRTAQTIFSTLMRLLPIGLETENFLPVLGILALELWILGWTMICLWDLARMTEGMEDA